MMWKGGKLASAGLRINRLQGADPWPLSSIEDNKFAWRTEDEMSDYRRGLRDGWSVAGRERNLKVRS